MAPKIFLVLQLVYKHFKKINNSNHISAGKQKGSFDKSIKPPATSNNSLAPASNHINTKLQVKFNGHCLKQDKAIFTQKQVVNNYIACKIKLWSGMQSHNFTVESHLFSTVTLTKNAGPDRHS